MTDRKYMHRGVDLQPLFDLMNQHLVLRRSSISGQGDLARALVDAGWRMVPDARATVGSDESEPTVDVKSGRANQPHLATELFELADFRRRKDAWPGLCVSLHVTGKHPIPWRPGQFVCGIPEQYAGEGACIKHRVEPLYKHPDLEKRS